MDYTLVFYLEAQYQIQSHRDFFLVFYAREFMFSFYLQMYDSFSVHFCIKVCVKAYFINICSFLYIDPMHNLLNLYLSTSFSDTIVKNNVSLISESSCLLLIYRKATKFCILTLHPTNLLYQLIISKKFCRFPGVLYMAYNIIKQ